MNPLLKLRMRIAEQGVELTPDELAESLDEAATRVGNGCIICHESVETPYGMCFDCFEKSGMREE